jgi:hypothetical protein
VTPTYGYPSPPVPPTLTPADGEQLTAVGVLFCVYGGFTGLASLLFGVVAVLPVLLGSHSSDPPPWFLSGIFLLLFGFAAALLFFQSLLMAFGGYGLCRRKHYVLCIVAAGVAMLNMPLGTALGIVTLFILQRPAVKAAFH